MENTTLTTKVVFMLTTSTYPTPLIIDVMDVDVAWHTRMDTYASQYASENGYVLQNWSEKNYGRAIDFQVKHIESSIIEKWTIQRSQPAHFHGDAQLNDTSRKCLQPMEI